MKNYSYILPAFLILASCSETNTTERTPTDTSMQQRPDSVSDTETSPIHTDSEVPASELNASERTVNFSKLDAYTAFKLTYGSAFTNEKSELLYKHKSEDDSKSYDGFYHMKLDTIRKFTTDSKDEWAVAVFKSVDYASKNELETSCHGCGSAIGLGLLKKEKGSWTAKQVNPVLGSYGSWGQAPDMDVAILVGKCFVIFHSGSTGQGYTEGTDQILWLSPDLPIEKSRVLSIGSHADNHGAVEENSPQRYSWDSKYEWKAENGKSILEVTYAGTESNDGKIRKKKGTERYVLNERKGVFEK